MNFASLPALRNHSRRLDPRTPINMIRQTRHRIQLRLTLSIRLLSNRARSPQGEPLPHLILLRIIASSSNQSCDTNTTQTQQLGELHAVVARIDAISVRSQSLLRIA